MACLVSRRACFTWKKDEFLIWCKHVCLEAVVCICSSKQVFSKFCKFHRKTLVLESLFNKVATLAEETLTQVHSISLPPSFYWGTTFSPKSWKVGDQKKMSVWGDLNSSYHIYLPGEEGGVSGAGLLCFLSKKTFKSKIWLWGLSFHCWSGLC